MVRQVTMSQPTNWSSFMNSSAEDGDERYTLPETDLLCRRLADVRNWRLDVAACAEASLGKRCYTKADNGLAQSWCAPTIWCNPPFSNIAPWVEKASLSIRDHAKKTIAMLLPATRTDQPWWHEWVEPFRDRKLGTIAPGVTLRCHFLKERTRFGLPGDRNGDNVGSPPFGCLLLVWRKR